MLVRRLARPMLASIFVSGGINALRKPAEHAAMAGSVAQKAASALPVSLPQDPQQLIKIDAAVKIGAGTLLSLNKFPRLAAVALITTLIPTTAAAHRFWEEDDPQSKANQQAHFFKNLGLLGGLLLAAVDTEGRPSVGWRARRAASRFSDVSRDAAEDAADAARRGRNAVRSAVPG